MMTRQQANWRLGLVLLIYSLVAVAQSLQLPLHKAPDEIAHFQYSRFIARHHRLPLNNEEREEAGYKAYQPPLFHGLVATLTGWSDSDNPPYLKFVWESPRFDLARELLDTKRLANTEDELMPYRGVILMWHLGRIISIVIGAGIIVLAYVTALKAMPKNYWLAVVSAAVIAFVPTFIFISASLSYESLVAFTIGLYFLILIQIVKIDAPRWILFISLGILMGVSVTAKYVAVILPAQVVLVFTYLAWTQKWPWRSWLKRLILTGFAAMLASSWWFLFLMANFNEIEEHGWVLGLLKPIIAGGGDTTQNYIAFSLTQGEIGAVQQYEIVSEPFWTWALHTYQTFWIEKIGDYPLGPVAHLLIGVAIALATVGLVQAWRHQPGKRIWIALFVFHVALFLIFPLIRFLIQGRLVQTAQGRHILFPVATVFPVLMVYGWQTLLSIKIQRWLALAVVGGLLVWSMAQLVRVATYYNLNTLLPVRTTADVSAQISHPLAKAFGDHLRLVGYDVAVNWSENAIKLSLYWRSPTYPDEDYRSRITLVQNGLTYLEWSAYPTNGRYPTRVWERWETIRDDYALPVVDLPPGEYELQLQLYGVHDPLPVEREDTLILTYLTVPDLPKFQPEIRLPIIIEGRAIIVEGLTLWQADDYRTLDLPEYQPRMAIPVVWQGEANSEERVEWLLVDHQGQVYPTQQASAHFAYFLVEPDWPTGEYRLRAEVWRGDSVVASQEIGPLLRVINEKPRLLKPPPIAHPLEANFDKKIKLLGYDLPVRSLSRGQGVPLTLYWQGLRTMGRDYTVFTKLLDNQQQVWGSAERLPADGYNTIYWLENEVVIDGFELPVDPNIPDGVYWLNVGLYEAIDNQAVSLPLVTAEQPGEVTSVTFGLLKIGGPPPGVVVDTALPEVALSLKFGDVIGLRGYDFKQAEDSLQVTLYWESLVEIDTNYTVFVHIRNEANETVAQTDRPLTDNVYPASLWASGEIIPEKVVVPLADVPPGKYSVRVGLYNFATGLRLSVAGSSDNSVKLLDRVIR